MFTGSLCDQPVKRCRSFRSGCLIMYLLIMVPVLSCAYLLMMTVTLSSQRNSIFRSSRLSPRMVKKFENMTEAYTEASGTMINSGEWNGMESSVLKKEAPHIIEEDGLSDARLSTTSCVTGYSPASVTGVSRSRSSTARSAAAVPVPEDQLPLKLPEVESYQPTGTGESPLAAIDEWVNTTCPVLWCSCKT